jgi:hypothetical protein
MKLNNEKKEVFKDPFPVASLADVGRVIVYGTMGAVGGAIAGAFGGLGVSLVAGAASSSTIMPLIIGGVAVGAVTGGAIGVMAAIKESGYNSLVKQAKKITRAPGFDGSVLDTPIRGLKVGERFIVDDKPTTNTSGAFLGAGFAGLAVASAIQRQKEREYDEMAADPKHRLGELVGHWDGEESLLRSGVSECRDTRPATLRDVLEFGDSIAGKGILRELIQTGRVDSYAAEPAAKVEVDAAAAERSSERLAGFMKATLKTEAPEQARSAPKPA